MKKVLIIIPSYSSGGGAEKILSSILNYEDFSEFNIDIVELYHGDKGYEKLPAQISVINHYTSYKYGKYINIILNQLAKKFPNLFRKYLIKQDDYDIEINFEICYPDIPFTRRCIKKISWVHGSIEEFASEKYSWRKDRYKTYFENASAIVAISNKTKQSIIELYPSFENKVNKVYNGYYFDEILNKSKEKSDFKIEELSLCSLGRIEYKKGSDKVLKTLERLHKKGYKYHLYYIGVGELESVLKKRVNQIGLDKYVHFLGYQTNPYKYLKYMKVLFSMSEQEGFSGAYVEALTLGIPFVSTDVGGAEELSQKGRFGKVISTEESLDNYIINYVEGKEKIDIEEVKSFLKQFDLSNQVAEFKKLILD